MTKDYLLVRRAPGVETCLLVVEAKEETITQLLKIDDAMNKALFGITLSNKQTKFSLKLDMDTEPGGPLCENSATLRLSTAHEQTIVGCPNLA